MGNIKTLSYRTRGVCSRQMDLELEDEIIRKVSILGGCNGNLKGICKLVEGRPAREIISLLQGVRCGDKGTSCPDQLATALKQALEEQTDG